MIARPDPKPIQYLENHYGASDRVLRQVMADGGEWFYRYHLQGATVTGPGCPGLLCPTEESWETVQAGYTFRGGTICETKVVEPVGDANALAGLNAAQTASALGGINFSRIPRGFRFNSRGNTISRTNDLGQKTTLTRGTNNRVISSINPLGRAINFAYDPRGNVTNIAEPGLQSTTIQYHPTLNKPTTLTNGLGYSRHAKYDTRGNQTESTNQLGFKSFISHNGGGHIIHIQFPEEQVPGTRFGYTSLGSLSSVTNPLGHVSSRIFDAASRVTSISGPRGFSTRLGYSGLNQVTRITNPRGSISTFGYDGNGNLSTRITANQKTYTHTYDGMDRLETTTDPLNRSFTFAYDRIGNVTGLTDRKNQPTDYSYDALNRPTSVTYADGSTVTPEYDRGGRLHRLVDSSAGTIEWVYDAFDRLIQEITPQGSVSYQYDAIGRRTQMIVNGQAPVIYDYDVANRLKRVDQGSVWAAMDYDRNDRRTVLTYSNGTSTTYGYDHAAQVTGITHNGPGGLIDQLTYQYDVDGNQTSVTRVNGTGATLPAVNVSAAYDVANQQTMFNGTALTYDDKGSLTNDGINTYTWDARDQLVAITGPGLTASFTYDGLGRRTSKTINGQTTTFVYDGGDIVAEVDSQEGVVTYLRGLSIDEPFIRHTSAGNEFYHADALGSTLALTDGTGNPTTTYAYDPFGQTTVAGSSTNAFQFTSREHDGTGLYYYRARYYSPTLHRFISEDPIGLAGGDENFYAYTFNSPTNYTDPSGTIGLGGCLTGIVIDAALSGRKPTLASVAGSCALGAIGGQAAKAAFAAVKGALKNIASKLGSQAAKAGNGAQTVDPNKLQHIFGQERHNLSDVVNQLGSQEKAFNAIQQATQNAAQSQGLKGVFETTVKVGTEIVTVRGNVIDGTVKIGTAFIP